MSTTPVTKVISHWHKPFDGFQTSALEFYSSVEAGLERRQIPDLSTSRVTLHEGGALSAQREYLRIRRQGLTFDLCAAPFGTGFFFSWWLSARRPSRWLLLLVLVQLAVAYICAINAGRALAIARYTHPPGHQVSTIIVLTITIGIGVFLLLGLVLRGLSRLWGGDPDDTAVVIPVIGPLYERSFKSTTFFRADTILMFQSLVKAAVEESIDAVTTANGLRALMEEEKKPIMRKLLSP